ncbi:Resolvase, Holliday junction-type [Ferroglobus placidus DSM 10642]|uniref:Crossover junction endodeoxyribonuclease Hjc n=1 Tax=Ferroglobus placidus (strain DSM 10642 / AEDII12DO) TaxID=589924 RepID=D3RZ75_FERPA|nr:Holliday junction resolvase Hjc [Ferroglobus placidus]ADC65788.1 Resolvase, Holliday junction-type [Ferroglobus placidus DSM 10642]
MKRKGSRFERELLELFWNNGFAAVRVAGSGSSSHPSPDLIVGNGKTFYALEVKMRKELPLYIEGEKIRELVMFSNLFGAKPLVAFKLPRKKWKFFTVADLVETERGYKIDESNYHLGKDFEEVVGKYKQERL